MRFLILVFCGILLVSYINAKPSVKDFFRKPLFKDFYGKLDCNIKVGDAGDPLILTDLIAQGNIDEAKSKAKVGPINGVASYSGYFRVDEVYDSNMFFWFFPSQTNYEEDPVIVWLQGGPGSTSMFGLFQEHGPLVFTGENELGLRNTSWAISNSMIYIDQPVGTGFSYTYDGYAQNETKVGADLYEALIQFFQLFPELQSNDFFITGESYAGKFVPAIGYTIHERNPSADLKINLKGLAIGNGVTDPEHQLRYSEYMYQHGLVDLLTRDIMVATENIALAFIKQGNYLRANDFMQQNMGTIADAATLDVYNYLTLVIDNSENDYMNKYFEREDVRRAIHVGNTVFNDDNVYYSLEADCAQSQAHLVAELLSHYRVLLYSGQTDIIVAYPTTVNYLQNLDFDAADIYAKAPRQKWYDAKDKSVIAGYVKTAGNLTEVMVRNAGHMVPSDQPEWALDLITKFVRNQPIAG